MKELLQQIGERIRDHRTFLDLTQAELAERALLNTSYIGQIERGLKEPSLKALFKIAAALNLSLSELFAEEAKENDALQDEVLRQLSLWSPEQQRAILEILRRLPTFRDEDEQ